jgi:hypothetical protein
VEQSSIKSCISPDAGNKLCHRQQSPLDKGECGQGTSRKLNYMWLFPRKKASPKKKKKLPIIYPTTTYPFKCLFSSFNTE